MHVRAGEAFENGFWLGGTHAQCRCIFDHLIILLPDQLPVNRPGQDRLEMIIDVRIAGSRAIQLLRSDSLEPRQQIKTQQVAKSERHLALTVAVDIVFLYEHVCAMAEHALDHCRYFRR